MPGAGGAGDALVRPDDGGSVGFTPSNVQTVRPGQPVSGVGVDIAIDSASLRKDTSGPVAVIKTRVRNTRGGLTGEECGTKPIVVIQDAQGYANAPVMDLDDVPGLAANPGADPATQLDDIGALVDDLTCPAKWRVGTTTEQTWEIPIESGGKPAVFGFYNPAVAGATTTPELTWISLQPFLN
ncbi:hypothetical protein M0E87_11235 [Corynebacterium sp. CCM 9185]|uniref:Uncharacterized protein n=2 Tax=Corynebacterium marambiense TaxID=2765364 RepID=A0ABS0VYI7_9CORY|nr:hypothetical protein [Corynebacterium marambiense]MBI9000468.1 hypothetical protein [Corynebacterium marambiense]MCK7664221.1 hypothetical protein [Corynebacterium marambiense]